MPIRPHDVPDFVTLTIDNYKKGKWERAIDEYPQYATARILSSKGMDEMGGAKLKWPLQTGTVNNARLAGLFDVDSTQVGTLASMAEVPWSCVTTSWAYDIYEDMFQDDALTIVNQIKMRENDALANLVVVNEGYFWGAPTSASDTRPAGVPYWIVKDATTAVDGDFTANLPSGHTTVAGIDPATVEGHRNWAFGYTAVTIDDLIRKIKRAMRNTMFEPPVPHPQLAFSGKADKEIWTTEDVLASMETECENRNENHGNELTKFVNNVVVGGVPVRISWHLNATDSSDPVYGIDWSYFRPFKKRGGYNQRTLKNSPTQRNVREVHYDNWYNYACFSRKRMWVGSTS
jgi:hypothetical protein